ncbi:SNF2 family N-terminal domain-containing protein [Stachybotrys elegans]|uniref:DNA helicase n=1 Tax=Stachybotrys elegans TaxID=80388 RepID=A0A8K0WPB0_9HYPO|nr:SNF2 family N-terminal domain-containing protein [Stachybotrys elegans]
MPETASPDSVANPVAPQIENDASTSRLDNEKPLESPAEPPVDADEPSRPVDSDAVTPNRRVDHEPPAEAHVNGSINGTANGHADDFGDDHGRPTKRRRTQDTPPPISPPPPPPSSARKIKPESPPWKRVAADGPTSFTENGRRKSGRINTLPLDLQPQGKKRMTRHSLGSAENPRTRQQNETPTATRPARSSAINGTQKPSPSAKNAATRPRALSTSKPPPKALSKQATAPTRTSSRTTRRRSPSPPPPPTRSNPRLRQASRLAAAKEQSTHQESTRSPRISLRINRSSVIPLVHPDQVRKRPRISETFEDFLERAGTIPVEEGGLQISEDGPPFTDEMARQEARVIVRIEEETEPGGLLSKEKCSLFVPDAVEEPPRQWFRQDHMTKAMANFRKLLLAEQQRHRATAKRLAEACRDEWLRRQPKSAEQLEVEARVYWIGRYRFVVKALAGTWENVRIQVNKKRLEAWEAEEQKRVKAALNEAVNKSELQLQARRGGLDSEQLSDDDGFDELSDDMSLGEGLDTGLSEALIAGGESDSASDGEGDDEDEDSDMMSSDDDDEAEDAKDGGDETLTQEQLRAKYANIPDVEPELDEKPDPDETLAVEQNKPESTDADAAAESQDTSDESVDMDDDMGSSDEDEDSDEGDADDESDEDESEEEAGGLLGFFGKSELQKMKGEAVDTEETPVDESKDEDMLDVGGEAVQGEAQSEKLDVVELVDEDEVSLIRHPDPDHEGLADPATPSVGVAEAKDEDTPRPTGAHDSDAITQSVEAEVGAVGERADAQETEKLPREEELVAPTAEDTTAEDVPMADAYNEAMEDNQPAVAVNDKPHSPETELVTNPPSLERSQSPRTSETKPSDVDGSPTAELAVAKSAPSRSSSPHSQSNHKTKIPFLLRGTLREYQHDGLDWLAGLYANNTNGILADEMGLGKTIQTIALLAHLACHHEVWGPHLVIVPTSVMLNWEMEFKKWCPGFKILAYYGSQEERKRKRQGWNNDDIWNVCITSYQLVLQDQQVFKRRRWHYMILDEAHNIKNFKSQRWQTLLGFNTHSRLLLTGTPLQNNLTELWSLLFFLMPAENGVGGFADLQEFHEWFQKPESQILENGREQMDDEARAIISKLHKVLRPYLLRRLKADVEKQMPAKYEHVEFCRLSKRQRELYDGFLSRADTKQTLAGGNYLSIINCLMQLRKVCNHPDLFVDRPIMTSFRMRQSVGADYEAQEQTVRRVLLAQKPMTTANLGFLNLIPTSYEHISSVVADRIAQLSSHRALSELKDTQRCRAQAAITGLDPTTVESNIAYLESAARWGRFEELQHCVYLNALRRQQRPVYGKNVIELLTLGTDKRPYKPRPKIPQKIMAWFEDDSTFVRAMTPSLDQRADSFKTTIEKFSCVTPAVVTRDLPQLLLGRRGVEAFTDEDLKLSAPVRWAPFMPKAPPLDPWHGARMRLTIQFPDKRLLQYDCGKLQALDKLLRKLQAGGHRALIFTQMTKVLDILEQFLNIHGHKYLRLDGATKVEQRQILTDRFNHDPRILCFILSTRSGGLGINLTGADTVIFYDQDWNPAMDKQCQDRCHRIGQTRDVHIYRLVSEHTIEANILRKASQKQMLDDVVIQEGEFTTDHFNKASVRDVLGDKLDMMSEGVSAADAALDRVLGRPESSNDQRTVGRVLEQAEDKEDVAAARVAEKEILADDADFIEKPSHPASGTSTARQGTPASKSALEASLYGNEGEQGDEEVEYNAWGDKIRTVDDYMLDSMADQLKHTKLEIPKDKKKGKKKGKDTRKR